MTEGGRSAIRGVGHAVALLGLILSFGAASASADAEKVERPAEYLVVFGKVKTLDTEVLDDLGLNVRITARLRITRVVSGHPPSSTVKILYIAHMSMPKNEEVRLRLRRSDNGLYLVCSEGGRGYICEDTP